MTAVPHNQPDVTMPLITRSVNLTFDVGFVFDMRTESSVNFDLNARRIKGRQYRRLSSNVKPGCCGGLERLSRGLGEISQVGPSSQVIHSVESSKLGTKLSETLSARNAEFESIREDGGLRTLERVPYPVLMRTG